MSKNISEKIHITGIKGVGVVGLATIFKEMGKDIRGSDTDEEFFTDRILRDLKISVQGFSADNINEDTDRLIHSTAYGKGHPEIERAHKLGIKVQSYTEALSELFNSKKGIMVTGTHGKTTTTAILSRIMEDAGFDPTVIAGGELIEWGRTARYGHSDWMIVEGDEYQAKILEMHPYAILVTNIDYDHPDFFTNYNEYEKMFIKLLKRSGNRGPVVVGSDILEKKIFSFLKRKSNVYGYDHKELKMHYIYGAYNESNASAALELSDRLGIDRKISLRAIRNFKGTKRRMEFYTHRNSSLVVIDDYAHHPTEIESLLNAIRKRYPTHHIIAVFQPHTYSRTKAFCRGFRDSFHDADEVVIMEVYASAREIRRDTGSGNITCLMKECGENSKCIRNVHDAVEIFKKYDYLPNTVLITIGAGDVWRIAKEVGAHLSSARRNTP